MVIDQIEIHERGRCIREVSKPARQVENGELCGGQLVSSEPLLQTAQLNFGQIGQGRKIG